MNNIDNVSTSDVVCKAPENDLLYNYKSINNEEGYTMKVLNSSKGSFGEALMNETSLSNKTIKHDFQISEHHSGPVKLICVDEEFLKGCVLLTTFMEIVVNHKDIPNCMNLCQKRLDKVYRNPYRSIDINTCMILWAHDIQFSPVCYGCELPLTKMNKFYRLFKLTFGEYDKIIDNDITDMLKLEITKFIMHLINAYFFNYVCEILCFQIADSVDVLNDETILRIKAAKIFVCSFPQQCLDEMMCLVICCPEQEKIVLITFKTGNLLPSEFQSDYIFERFLNFNKLRPRSYLKNKKQFNQLSSWQTYRFQNYTSNSLSHFHQIYLAYMWIGHKLTISDDPMEFMYNLSNHDQNNQYIESMFEFINRFEQKSVTTLLAITLLNENLYHYVGDNDEDNNNNNKYDGNNNNKNYSDDNNNNKDNNTTNDKNSNSNNNDNNNDIDNIIPTDQMLTCEVNIIPQGVELQRALRRAPLSDNDLQLVNDFLNKKHFSHGVVTDKFNMDMTEHKLSCLIDGTWLNDEVINFYMCMLQHRDDRLTSASNGVKLSSYYFNSFFINKLISKNGDYDYKIVERWTKKMNVFLLDKMFMPVNIGNTHWAMIVVYMKLKRIHYYDSLNRPGIDKYLKHVLQWLKDEDSIKYVNENNFDERDWLLMDQETTVPHQNNSYDCGVFSTLCADFISDDIPLHDSYKQFEIKDYRKKILAAIFRGSITY